jgi:hypothetical protein
MTSLNNDLWTEVSVERLEDREEYSVALAPNCCLFICANCCVQCVTCCVRCVF